MLRVNIIFYIYIFDIISLKFSKKQNKTKQNYIIKIIKVILIYYVFIYYYGKLKK